MSKNSEILISSCNLSGQINSELSAALDFLLRENHVFKFIESSTRAHLVIIDVDNDAGKSALMNSFKGQVKLLLSSDNETGKNIITLKKPVNRQNFISVLSKLLNMMYEQMSKVSADKNAPVNNVEIIDTIFYRLLQAKKLQQILYISTPKSEIYVDGRNKSIKCQVGIEGVRQIFNLPFSELQIKPIDNATFHVKTSNLQVVTLHNALWSAAITCSKGALLPEHDMDKAVKLRAWPSFTRNDFKPEHLKLAAIMAQRSISLAELTKITDISHSDIVDFYNAAYAVDLIDENIQPNQVTAEVQSPQSDRKTTLLRKIATRLGFSQSANGTHHG